MSRAVTETDVEKCIFNDSDAFPTRIGTKDNFSF